MGRGVDGRIDVRNLWCSFAQIQREIPVLKEHDIRISRRQFLRAANGAALALPFMPSVAGAAAAARPDKKLLIMYVPNGLVRRCFFPGEMNRDLPAFVGGFDADKVKEQKRIKNTPGIYPLQITPTMQPLEKLADDVTLITGLDRTYQNGQDVHAQGASCYMTSVSPEQAEKSRMRHPNGRSLDQVIGDKVGHSTIFKTLEISCNGFKAPKEDIYFDNISWYGPDRIAPSIKDPRKLYRRLFVGDGYRRRIGDVTDLMRADANDLSQKLGQADRRTLTEFMEMVRDIEVRITKLEKLIAGAGVKEPTDADLPRGQYIKLMGDMMIMAMQMGITNICTFMVGPERWDAPLFYEGVFPKPVQHHDMTHNQKGDGWKELQKIDLFHMEQYAYILSKMKSVKESDGSSILDNSIVTYGAGLGDGSTHQYYDLPLLVAGRAQGAIKQGRFIQCKSGTLNSNMWLTIAKLMGLGIDQFADSDGVISDLWQ